MKLTKYAKSRAKFYRNARAGAVKRCFLEGGDFIERWCPTLRGRMVRYNSGRHEQREAAIQEARAFREYCRYLLDSKP